MSRYLPMLAELYHSHFAEISHELAAELGIDNGERITVIEPARQGARDRDGHQPPQAVHDRRQEGAPDRRALALGLERHRGLPGSKGDITNDLSATVGDPTVYIQETKAFVCNVKKGEV